MEHRKEGLSARWRRSTPSHSSLYCQQGWRLIVGNHLTQAFASRTFKKTADKKINLLAKAATKRYIWDLIQTVT
jgi:hypothetical protein